MTRDTMTTNGAAQAPIDELRRLPLLEPPAALRRRVDAMVRDAAPQAPTRRRPLMTGGFALAASVAVAVWVALPLRAPAPSPEATGGGPVAGSGGRPESATLEALMARSAYLESVLAAVPRRGRVQRVGTASTITALEDRVALIDAQLSRPDVAADAGDRAVLWRERVGLMNTLVSLHAEPATTVML